MNQTTEKAFESYLEETLIDKSWWKQGLNKDWDKQLALFRSKVVAFIKDTQPTLWQEMDALHGEILPNKLITTTVDVRGNISL